MNTLGIEKRTQKLFVRITPTNKKWVAMESKRQEVPEAEWVDFLITEMRKLARDSDSKKSKKRSKKT